MNTVIKLTHTRHLQTLTLNEAFLDSGKNLENFVKTFKFLKV